MMGNFRSLAKALLEDKGNQCLTLESNDCYVDNPTSSTMSVFCPISKAAMFDVAYCPCSLDQDT